MHLNPDYEDGEVRKNCEDDENCEDGENSGY